MATLNMAFGIAVNALEADQTALSINANNVANQNTPGYTREVANWEQSDPVTINGQVMGTGATVTGALSQRSLVLERILQQQSQVENASSARLSALDQVQNIFPAAASASSSSQGTGIGADISNFFNAFSSLEGNPSDTSLRQSVLTAATTLANDFQSASSQLTQQQASLSQQSVGIVSQVNALTSSIAQLNKQIQSSSPHADAGTLEDQRQQDITQLSQLIGIDQITTENNGISITTPGGVPLVSEQQSLALSTGTLNGVTHIYDAQGGDITSDLTSAGGQLGGILTVRDQDIPNMQNQLDTLAFNLGTAVNTANIGGLDAKGNPGVAIFNLTASATGAAAGISVAITTPSQIAAASAAAGTTPAEGSGGSGNAKVMANLANQAIVGGLTATAFFSQALSGLGSLVSQVSTENTAQQASLTQMQNQVNSLSAVDPNEEAASLQNLEQSYEAASKIFTILDSVMTSALNLGVQTSFAS